MAKAQRSRRPADEARVVLGDPELRDALARELRRRGVPVRPLPPRQDPPGPDRAGLDRARLAFQQLEVGAALAEVEAWLAAVDAGTTPVRVEDLRDALLLKARIELALGRDAGPTLRRARSIDPSYELDPVQHQPSLLEAWRAATVPEPIEVHFEGPPGLRVRVDGREVDAVTWLVPGPHVVSFEAPGRRPWRGLREVGSRVHASLATDPLATLHDARALTQPVRSAAATLLGAVPLVVLRDGRRVVAVDGGGLGRAAVPLASGEPSGVVARRLAAALRMSRAIRRNDPAPRPKRPWRWVAVAVAGALAIVGGVAAAVVLRRDEGWEARYQP